MFLRYSTDISKTDKRLPKVAKVYSKHDIKIDCAFIDSDAIAIISRLKQRGFEAFLVGGAVRDLILNINPKDFDIATNATPSQIRKIFRNSRIIGRRFKIAHIFFGEKIFEITTFRALGVNSLGNEFGTIEQDVVRRDFTLNAIYFDPIRQHLIDFVGGIQDIQKRLIRPIIPLKTIFIDDPVRMVRAVKYKATTNFNFTMFVPSKIKRSAHLLKDISPSRITEEVFKIIRSEHPDSIVREMINFGIYGYLQKEANELCLQSEFRDKYFSSLAELGKLNASTENLSLSKGLYYFIRDFTKKTVAELRKEEVTVGAIVQRAKVLIRAYVKPINPPNIQLRSAIYSALEDCGIKRNSKKKKKAKSKEVNK